MLETTSVGSPTWYCSAHIELDGSWLGNMREKCSSKTETPSLRPPTHWANLPGISSFFSALLFLAPSQLSALLHPSIPVTASSPPSQPPTIWLALNLEVDLEFIFSFEKRPYLKLINSGCSNGPSGGSKAGLQEEHRRRHGCMWRASTSGCRRGGLRLTAVE
jgi:hypothetical protein